MIWLLPVQIITSVGCLVALVVNYRSYRRYSHEAYDLAEQRRALIALTQSLADRVSSEHGCDVCHREMSDGDNAAIRRAPDGTVWVAHAMCMPPIPPTEPA